MALISKVIRCAQCGSSDVTYREDTKLYHCACCGADCDHTMPAADLATLNEIAAMGGNSEKLAELRKRYPRLGITSWSRETRVQL